MFHKTVSAAIALATLTTPVVAQQFAGGELTIDATGYSEGDDVSSVDYSLALEYGLGRNFGAAIDISQYDFSLLNDNITNVTLHGVYHINDQSSLGVLIGTERLSGETTNFYGLEGGFEAGEFNGEGYFAIYDSDDTAVVGLSGTYDINGSVAAIADLGFGTIGDNEVTRVSAGAEYQFNNGPSVYT